MEGYSLNEKQKKKFLEMFSPEINTIDFRKDGNKYFVYINGGEKKFKIDKATYYQFMC